MNSINYSGLYRTFIAAAGLLILSLNSSDSFAVPAVPAGMPNGGCWADPMNNLTIRLGAAQFSSNTVGSIATINFTTSPESYPGWCYATSDNGGNGYEAGMFMSVIRQPISAGYYILSDYIEYKIISNDLGPFPFIDINNFGAIRGPTSAGVTRLEYAKIGNSGTITFRLRRTLIGGALFFPGNIELASLYRYVFPKHPPTVPIFRLVTVQSVIPVPVECRINNGVQINVPFGNIDSALVTPDAATSSFRQVRNLNYECNTALTQDIKVSLAADPAGFGDAIKTSNPDIGVVMQYKNQTVKPNDGFKTRLVNGQGSDEVAFAVVGSGKKPATGPFTGSATLIINSL